MKQKLKPVSEMTTAEELLAQVAEIRDRVRALPEEEQKKYYEGDKAEDKQLGEEIRGEDEETPGVDEGGNKEPEKEPAPNADENKETPDVSDKEAPPAENPETPPQETPRETPLEKPKENEMDVLLEVRELLRQNLVLEKQEQEQQEETPKSEEDLGKPNPTDEEESYEDEDFFK